MPNPVTLCPGSQKIAMNRAWRLAREGQRIYGGSVRQFLGEALRICWAELKADPAAKVAAELFNEARARRLAPRPITGPTRYLAKIAARRSNGRVWGSSYL